MDRKFINRTYMMIILISICLITCFLLFTIFPFVSEDFTPEDKEFYVYAPLGTQREYFTTKNKSMVWSVYMTAFTIDSRNNDLTYDPVIEDLINQKDLIIYNFWAILTLIVVAFIGFVFNLSKKYVKYFKYLFYSGSLLIFLSISLFYLFLKLGFTIDNSSNLYQASLRVYPNIGLPISTLIVIDIILITLMAGSLVYTGLIVDFLFIKKKSLADEYVGFTKTKKPKKTDDSFLDDFPTPNKKPMFQDKSPVLNADLDLKLKKSIHQRPDPIKVINQREPDDDFLKELEEKKPIANTEKEDKKSMIEEYDYFDSNDKKEEKTYNQEDVSNVKEEINEKTTDKKEPVLEDKDVFSQPIFKEKPAVVDLNKEKPMPVKPKKFEEVKPSEDFQNVLSSAIDKKKKERQK